MAAKPTQPPSETARKDMIDRMDRSDPAQPSGWKDREEQINRKNQPGGGADPCTTPIDRNAPAGAKNSLGAKSDCGGRPTTDDSVVEAKDELDPSIPPPMPEPRSGRK